MFGQTNSGTVKRDLERAGESIADGDFKGAGKDISSATSHTGDVIGKQSQTASENTGDTMNSIKDTLTSAGHSVQEAFHGAVQTAEDRK